jgi:hypothetical protein
LGKSSLHRVDGPFNKPSKSCGFSARSAKSLLPTGSKKNSTDDLYLVWIDKRNQMLSVKSAGDLDV